MRVLQINKFYEPHVGGVETVVRQLAEGLHERVEEVRILTCHDQVHPFSTEEVREGLKVFRAGTFGTFAKASLSPHFLSLYRREVQWADLVHFHVPSPMPELAHRILGVPSEVSVVVTFHADPTLTRWRHMAQLYNQLLIKPLLRRADAIVGTAPNNIDNSSLLSHFREKCTVIPLATDYTVQSNTLKNQRLHKRQISGVSPEEPMILFVGRVAYYKGIRILLESMRDVDATLVIVGDGDDREALEQEARKKGVDDRVHFTGFISDEMLPGYYRAADIFVLPSVEPAEAFGIVQLDAMAHGVPVVNTSLPTGVPFVSLHEETGLTVQPEDSEALAKALGRLVENEDLREEYGIEAANRARKFTTDKMLKRYVSLYKANFQCAPQGTTLDASISCSGRGDI